MSYVWAIDYNGALSKECYNTEEKAIKRLESQGYKQIIGYLFKNEEDDYCKLYCLSVK